MGSGVTARPDVPSRCNELFRYRNLVSRSGRLMVVVLQPPAHPGMLLCDGAPLTDKHPWRCSAPLVPMESDDVRPGDRFFDPESGLTVICPRGGAGTLTFDGRLLRRLRSPA